MLENIKKKIQNINTKLILIEVYLVTFLEIKKYKYDIFRFIIFKVAREVTSF